MELQLVVIVISILLSAFFSGMEIAFVSANKMHIELEKKREGFMAKILTRLTQKSSKFITTMLVGNNIALVVYSFFMGEDAAGLSGKAFTGFHGSLGLRWNFIPMFAFFAEGGLGSSSYELEGKKAGLAYTVLGGLQIIL
jgi:CBS domain containing-hemolysin-like protein